MHRRLGRRERRGIRSEPSDKFKAPVSSGAFCVMGVSQCPLWSKADNPSRVKIARLSAVPRKRPFKENESELTRAEAFAEGRKIVDKVENRKIISPIYR